MPTWGIHQFRNYSSSELWIWKFEYRRNHFENCMKKHMDTSINTYVNKILYPNQNKKLLCEHRKRNIIDVLHIGVRFK